MGVGTKYLNLKKWSFRGTLVVFFGSCLWVGSDWTAGKAFRFFKPQIEQKLSGSIGRPVRIGPYEGLRPWGIAIGHTKFLPGLKDSSSLEASALTVNFAPLKSLLRWRPVAMIKPKGTVLNLLRNKDGQYWVKSDLKSGQPFSLDLFLDLRDAARVRIKHAQLDLLLSGQSTFQIAEKRAVGSVYVGLPNEGKLLLTGSSSWDQLELNAHARFESINLQPLQGLFDEKLSLAIEGLIGGDVQLNIKEEGKFSCRGGLNLVNFNLKGRPLRNFLSSKKATIECSKDIVRFKESQWIYGPWKIGLEGYLPIIKDKISKLNISGSASLKKFSEDGLSFRAGLPLEFSEKGFILGDLNADLGLKSFPLSHLEEILGFSMAGNLSAKGQIKGPLTGLTSDFSLRVLNPQVGGFRLQEEWIGSLAGELAGGGSLQMKSTSAVLPGTLKAKLRKNWLPEKLTISRKDGTLSLQQKGDGYRWKLKDFNLEGVEIAISPKKSFEAIYGLVSGQGGLGLGQFGFDGQIAMSYLRFMGFKLQEAKLQGSLVERNYKLTAELSPPTQGSFLLSADGRIGGSIRSIIKMKEVSPRWMVNNALQFSVINSGVKPAFGNAKDLGASFINTFGGSLDDLLRALSESEKSLVNSDHKSQNKNFVNTEDLRGKIDASVELKGPDLRKLDLNLQVGGHIWKKEESAKVALRKKPFLVRLKGPLAGGVGEFSLLDFPSSTLSLLGPITPRFNSSLGIRGKYKLDTKTPEFNGELLFKDERSSDNEIILDRGKVLFRRNVFEVDVALRNVSSKEAVSFRGFLPIDPLSQIDLKVETKGDGLKLLNGLTDGSVLWKSGRADLEFLLKGSRIDPKFEGSLTLSKGSLEVLEEVVEDLDVSLNLNPKRLELKRLQARIGSNGTLKGNGALPIFLANKEDDLLNLGIKKVRLRLPTANVELAGDVKLKGALLNPSFGGELSISDGFISPVRSAFATSRRPTFNSNPSNRTPLKSSSMPKDEIPSMLEKWDFNQPLVLLSNEGEAPMSTKIRSAMPNFPKLSFDNFNLRLGPNLRITSQPLADFRTEGLLKLNGPLDSTMKASGVVRLLNGRVNLFTTTFNLDRRSPNVAVFTPSLGFVPYIDVALITRVSEKNISEAGKITSSSDFSSNGSGGVGVGGFRLIKVKVEASGPADRITENFKLSSTPPMQRDEIFGLIGGNSLRELLGGEEQNILANVIGKSVLSPVLGNISGAFSERLQVALYPAYVTPDPSKKTTETQSGSQEQTPTGQSNQQAWVTEVGVDLTERFNLSFLATPNRNDIPSQTTLNYQVTPSLGLVGSLDREGTWQSRLQLFFRF
ncbi:translocation/assembly module TamB domain-containing protein [Prochlorococcus sp. MIT 1300]|uniref:translocation/assembly module TamB domain-containing protein n=1 Tax=Prochlorococcus sp. MIT 1300 TaxID=3096218 RepID=UPI002A75AE80|nr:translocation/assembly module TamB domain-containing protein [Prochlorococcus sp. MIT 1300]